MAVSLVQEVTKQINSTITSISVDLPAPATAGNIIWACVGVDRVTGGTTVLPGFTMLYDLTDRSLSVCVGYRIALGGETNVSCSFPNVSTLGATVWVGEYTDETAPGGEWVVESTASNPTNEATVTSWPSGTTASLTNTFLSGLAFWSIDRSSNIASGQALTNGYSFVRQFGSTTGGDVAVGWKATLASGSTTSSTFSYTGTADQMSAAIAAFGRTPTVLVDPYPTYTPTAGEEPVVKVEIAWEGNALDSSPVWFDVTDWVDDMQWSRGRNMELDQLEAGTATFTLDNSDGRFTPGNPSSPYFPNVLPRKQIRVTSTYGGVTTYHHRGNIERWPVTADYSSTVQVTSSDILKYLNGYKLDNSDVFRLLDTNPRQWFSCQTGEGIQALTGQEWPGVITRDTFSENYYILNMLNLNYSTRNNDITSTGRDFFQPSLDGPSLVPSGRGKSLVTGSAVNNGQAGWSGGGGYIHGGSAFLWPSYLMSDSYSGAQTLAFSFRLMETGDYSHDIPLLVCVTSSNVILSKIVVRRSSKRLRIALNPAGSNGMPEQDIGPLIYKDTNYQLIIATDPSTKQIRISVNGSVTTIDGSSYTWPSTPTSVWGVYGTYYNPLTSTNYQQANVAYAHFMRWYGYALTQEEMEQASADGWLKSGVSEIARMGNLLDFLGVEPADRLFDPSVGVLGQDSWDDGTTALSLLRRWASGAMNGYVFANGAGQITYYNTNRSALDVNFPLTFDTNAGTGVEPSSTFEIDENMIYNVVQVVQPGGLKRTLKDQPSIEAFGKRTYEYVTNCATASDALLKGQQFLARYKSPVVRVNEMRVKPSAHATGGLWSNVLSLEIGRFIEVKGLPAGAPQSDMSFFLERMTHHVRRQGGVLNWEVTMGLSPSFGMGS